MRPLQIAVAGCGPAGLSAALFLSRDGHRVSLFDQMDAPQPIGSGLMLQPTGLAALQALGLAREIAALGCPIERMRGRSTPSGRIILDVAYDPHGAGLNGLAVHRGALFGLLHRAVLDARLPVEPARRIVALQSESGGRASLRDARGARRGPFDLVVDALGANSPLAADDRRAAGARRLRFGALWATLPWPGAPFERRWLEQRYRRSDRMIGVMPVGRIAPGGAEQAALFWSLPPADHAAWLSAGLDAWKDEARALWPQTEPLLGAIDDPAALTLAAYAHFTLPYPAGTAVARIGDSAHAASPQLGQGANMALLDSWALAAALARETELEKALDLYVRMRGLYVRLYQALSLIFTPFYQSDSRLLPWLRDRLIWPLSTLSPMRSLLALLVQGRLVDPLRRLRVHVAAERA